MPEVRDRNDVGVIEAGCALGLSTEATGDLRVITELGVEDLDRHISLQEKMMGSVDRSHATLTQHGVEAVAICEHRAADGL